MRTRTTRPAIFRMTRIHEAIVSGRFPSAPAIARDIEVSCRTVQRDIEYMRDILGARIEYDPSRHGYYYSEHGVELPVARISEGELVSLLVGTKVLEQYAGTPFEADLKRAFGRIAENLPEEVSVHLGELASAMSFSLTCPRPADLALFSRLTEAIRKRRRLRITYTSLSSGKSLVGANRETWAASGGHAISPCRRPPDTSSPRWPQAPTTNRALHPRLCVPKS